MLGNSSVTIMSKNFLNRKPFYINKLLEEFNLRKKKNKRYSMRAYAKSFKIDPATLYNVLTSRRSLPIKYAEKVASGINLTKSEYQKFINSIHIHSSSIPAKLSAKFDNTPSIPISSSFQIVSEWEYQAIISLCKLQDFVFDIDWISERLGISKKRTRDCLDLLIKKRIIQLEKDGGVSLHQPYLHFEAQSPKDSEAIKLISIDSLRAAEKQLNEIPSSLMGFGGGFLAIDLKSIPELKRRIKHFILSLEHLISDDSATDVYQIGIQLFPRTKILKDLNN